MKEWEYNKARDIGLSERDRLVSASRETGLLAHLVQCASYAALRASFRLYHRLRVTGLEYVPQDPPFLVCANHASHLDALLLAAALPHRLRESTYLISAGDVFFTSFHRALFTTLLLNTLPISRSGAGRHALASMRARLVEEPCNYIIFPEGKRSRDGSLLPLKPGVGMLCAGSSSSVVPCWIEGAHQAMPPGAKTIKPTRIQVRFGEPVSYESKENSKQGWTEIRDDLRARIIALRK